MLFKLVLFIGWLGDIEILIGLFVVFEFILNIVFSLRNWIFLFEVEVFGFIELRGSVVVGVMLLWVFFILLICDCFVLVNNGLIVVVCGFKLFNDGLLLFDVLFVIFVLLLFNVLFMRSVGLMLVDVCCFEVDIGIVLVNDGFIFLFIVLFWVEFLMFVFCFKFWFVLL